MQNQEKAKEKVAEKEEEMPKKKPKIVTNKVKGTPLKPVIQEHHITYAPERTVLVYKSEHYILTQLQWRRYISKGLIVALQQFVKDYKHLAFPLKKPKKKVARKKKATRKPTRRKRGVKRSTRTTRRTSGKSKT